MYIADLHIHSKYSRATSRECVPEYLELWARRKGIQLLGTGDFTHPAWRKELQEKLHPAEEGLYLLKEEYRKKDQAATDDCPTRFVITGEISSIYKKHGRVRKVHNLILLPSLEAAETLSHKLEAIGNIHSDGRPILGLDSRDLLEITLEACPEAELIPAHIWTPHFSLFGAFSGFDTIEECFEDLTPHIHALETGLSSDPAMNWRVSALDRYTLVSNSDAHSPSKLGREANLLEGELSYPALRQAVQRGKAGGFGGTIEFFPEEGKYHYDGHRNCKLCLTPLQAEELGGICPVCGKKLTIGVQHRVEQLADRHEGFVLPNAPAYESLVPLPEVLAASTGRSPTGAKVLSLYEKLLRELGSEFSILREVPLSDIGQLAGPCVQEGMRRLRAGEVERQPGFDGEYGVIQLLDPSEMEALNGQTSLFAVKPLIRKKKAESISRPIVNQQQTKQPLQPKEQRDLLAQLNDEQRTAVTSQGPTIAVIAGPGTGKTKTLISRISYLVQHCGVKPAEITAVTFTNKAAGEMKERLEKELKGKRAANAVTVGTFHSICLQLLSQWGEEVCLASEEETGEIAEQMIREQELRISPRKFLQEISAQKNGTAQGESALAPELVALYQERLQQEKRMDFDDLLLKVLYLWEKKGCQQKRRFSYLLVDEFQDINEIQYQLICAWAKESKSLFVIGDPDQSIYGFRGSSSRCFHRLPGDFPEYQEIQLKENYRSSPQILRCALQAISHNKGPERMLHANKSAGSPVHLITAGSDRSEAIFVAKSINRMVGGIDMLDAQFLSAAAHLPTVHSFSDIAVLYRTHHQARLIESCLRKEGIPCWISGRDDTLADPIVRGTVGFFRSLIKSQEISSLRMALCNLWSCPPDITAHFIQTWEEQRKEEIPTKEWISQVYASFSDIPFLAEWKHAAEQFLPILFQEKPYKLLELFVPILKLELTAPYERLMNMAVFYDDMPSFLQNLLLGQEADLIRSTGKEYKSGAVHMMTLHGAKGLEFPVVFLCGVRRGLLPLESAGQPADTEEERRLFYVGMTRAQEELFLLTSQEKSLFLEDFSQEEIEVGQTGGFAQPFTGRQLSLFD